MEKNEAMPNWCELDPSVSDKIFQRTTYLVTDYVMPDGKYFLDRFFISNEVHIRYPGKDLKNDQFPNCIAYFIQFKRKDTDRVQKALTEMNSKISLVDDKGEYRASVLFLNENVFKEIENDRGK